MLAFYILIGVLTLGIIAAVVMMTRSRERPAHAEPPEVSARGPRTLVRVVEEEPAPQVPDDFDPGETLVYRRSSETAASPRKRDDSGSAVTSGARLVGLSGAYKGKSFAVGAAGLTVGRSPYSDVVLGDPRVSFRHAWIGIVGDMAMLRDLKSTNGTFLNAQLNARVTETPLRSGDTIFFGGHRGDQFRFVVD